MAAEEGAAASINDPVGIIDLTWDDSDDDDEILFVGVKESHLTGDDAPPRGGAAPLVSRKSIKTEASKSIKTEEKNAVASPTSTEKMPVSSTTTAAAAATKSEKTATAAGLASSEAAAASTTTSTSTKKQMGATVSKTSPVVHAPEIPRNAHDAKLPPKQNDEQTNKSSLSSTVTSNRKEPSNNAPPQSPLASKLSSLSGSNAPPLYKNQLVNQNSSSTAVAAAAAPETRTSKFSIFSALKERFIHSSTAAVSKKAPSALPASTPKITASTSTKSKQPQILQNPSVNSQASSTSSSATKQSPTVPNPTMAESTAQVSSSSTNTATKQPPIVLNSSMKTMKQPPIAPNPTAIDSTTQNLSSANTKAAATAAKLTTTTTKRVMSVSKKSATRVPSTANTTSKRPLTVPNASAAPLDPENAKTMAATGKEVPSDPRGAAAAFPPSPSAKSVADTDTAAAKDSTDSTYSTSKPSSKLPNGPAVVNSNKLPDASAPMHQHSRDSSISNKSTSSTVSVSTSSNHRAVEPSSSGTQGQHRQKGVAPDFSGSKRTVSTTNDTTASGEKRAVHVFQPVQYTGRQMRVARKSTKLKIPVQRLVSYDESRLRSISINTNAESGNDKTGDPGEDSSSAASTSTNANAPVGQMVAGRQSTSLSDPAPTATQNQPKASTSEHPQNRKRHRGCLRLADSDSDSDSSDDSDADLEPAVKIPKTGKDAPKVSSTASTSESSRNNSVRTAEAESFDCTATQNIVSSATSSPRNDDPDEEYTEDGSTCADSSRVETRARMSSERKPSSAVSVESDSKRMRLKDGDQESNQSPATHVGLKDYDSKTWIDGNGISKERAASFLPYDLKQCDSCRACATTRCGICGLCCFGPAGACVLRCCTNNEAATKQKYHDEIERMLIGRKNRGLVVGMHVRARRSSDQNQWFWGSIGKKYKHSSGNHNLYTIIFEDGSSKHMVPGKNILDVFEDILTEEVKCLRSVEEQPSFESRCACLRCTQPRCGQCIVCRGENYVFASFLPDGTRCLQNMCLKNQAPQKAPGLAYGWTYGFGTPPTNPEVNSFRGLWLQSPAGLKFLSIERANGRFSKEVFDKATFYGFVGLPNAVDLRYTSLDSAPTSRTTNGDQEPAAAASCVGVPTTTACGTCYNCTKAACGSCNVCRDSSSNAVCLQKMCLEHQEPRSAPGLAAGWKYVFGKLPASDHSVDDFKGLRIVAPNGLPFKSLERAINARTAPAAGAVFDVEAFYEFVGLCGAVDRKHPNGVASRPRQSVDGFDREYSHELNVGSRCYAKFTNGWYYWGEITALKGNCGRLFYDVQFDDGDFLSGIESGLVETEKAAYAGSAPLPILPDSSQSLGLLDLHAQRCKACTLCKRDECGRCHACKINAESTQSERMACVMKMCAEIDKEKKSQHIPGLAKIWKYYFTANEGSGRDIPSELTELTALHPDSLLHVFVGDIRFECLKEAMEAANYPRETVIRTVKQFYEEHLGIPLRRQEKHPLVGCGYYTEWIDARGQRREIYGTITDCWESMLDADRKLSFTVRYDERMILWAKQMSSTKLQIPECREVSEELAWCGHVAWRKKEMDVSLVPKLVKAPFHLNWIVPGTRFKEFDQPLPSITMVVAGYEFCLKAQQSGIKNAGLGLFVRITNRAGPSRPEQVFELPAGHLVDFGVYAPCTDEECKIEQVVVMKNFLLHYFAEGYCFDKETGIKTDFDLFDVSHDHEQSLTKASSENLMVFANESDGKTEVPTLVCRYDPEGALHYLLGYDEEHLGPLQIPFDEEFELKIDYGKLYEKVRVRKGYARVTGAKKKDLIEACHHDDAETIDDIGRWSLSSVAECLRVLEKCLGDESFRPNTNDFFERALIFALGLRARVKSIEEEFRDVDLSQTEEYCDNGVSTMAKNGTVQLSARIVTMASNRCSSNAGGLKSKVLCHKLLKGCVMKCLHLAEDALMRIDAGELRQLILSFPE